MAVKKNQHKINGSRRGEETKGGKEVDHREINSLQFRIGGTDSGAEGRPMKGREED